jgi:hypothetical protein
MMKKFLWSVWFLIGQVHAASGLGGVANNLLEPVGFASDFITTGCFILGAGFLFASLIKYVEHRRNEHAVPIGTVVFLLIAGLALVAVPFAYLLVNNGSPYSLIRR